MTTIEQDLEKLKQVGDSFETINKEIRTNRENDLKCFSEVNEMVSQLKSQSIFDK